MSSTQISDELWQHQDPAAARLSRRARHWLWLSALAALIVVLALPAALHAGAFEPQVRATDRGWNGMFIDSSGGTESATFGGAISADVSGTTTIVNAGSLTVRVLSITIAGDGFRFDHATVGDTYVDGDTVHPGGRRLTPAAPAILTAGAALDITLFLTITDCHAVPAAQQFATIRIDSWRGIQTVRVALPTVRHIQGGWEVTTPADPQGISSLHYLADAVCGIGMETG
jgi:hypothetical protein